MKSIWVLLAALIVLAVLTSANADELSSVTTIQNKVPRTDTHGNIMDIHDGNTLLIDGVYYYYGSAYGNCIEPKGVSGCSGVAIGSCGFRLDHNVSLYTSTDLATWEPHAPVFQFALDNPYPGIMFCPKVIYNAKTQLYVMWYNWLPPDISFTLSYFGSAVSSSPVGPFKVVNANASDTLAFDNVGDFALFVDDDASAYIIYTAHISGKWGPSNETHRMSVERLSDDYTTALGKTASSGFFGIGYVEAPAMFKRNDVYYALFGFCCCYCMQGSAPFVYVAKHPLGPYQCAQQGLGGQCATITSGIPAQQTNVLPFKDASGKRQYLWQGDMWQSAPDHIKGHDLSYWGLLSFSFFGGHPQTLKYVEAFNITMP